ncbi:magnesium transporter CorA family protein [Xanthobacter sp. TB0139]|uniref:magnesium transporter CorA family protein n=1 Tax=Xanthobacter sp. TB0139 TaxID=3459178 RepID=UPI00403A2881
MILSYLPADGHLQAETPADNSPDLPSAVWIDMICPTEAEEAAVERATGIEIPTHEEMVEIEQSSRLYVQNGARYMTASLLCRDADTQIAEGTAVTFILCGNQLIIVRYAEPRVFKAVATHLARTCPLDVTGEKILIEILEAVVDRGADMLEQIGMEVDGLSRRVFDHDENGNRRNASQRYRDILAEIGRKERLLSATRESLASLQRLLSFLGADAAGLSVTRESKISIKSMSRDVAGLSDYAAFMSGKLQFMLDATIGMVGLEQNNIIKIFAVLSVVLMPPTLIASIYGMNFSHMPELQVSFAYPLTLAAMVLSGILPYVFFKLRGWL